MQQYTEFGLKARSVMLKKQLTLTNLADELGISCSYLSEIFKGTRNGANHKEKIKKILGLTECSNTEGEGEKE